MLTYSLDGNPYADLGDKKTIQYTNSSGRLNGLCKYKKENTIRVRNKTLLCSTYEKPYSNVVHTSALPVPST